MTHKTRAHLPGSVRLAALVLAALALCAFLTVRPARAADWMTPYLEKVQEWGVIRADSSGSLHEDQNLTRAEFVTMMNRAFGYVETGPIPFADVPPNAWYAEDIAIAYHAGYFGGTSATTASPMNLVTREQAAVFLGRCLRFQGVPNAANSTFTDMREIGGWSRALVQEAADLGIIGGYSDGTFRPKQPITRGQMACFLVRALGTLVQEPGEQTSGGVYGNLTITTPGVKLKDTVVTGNLYLTGGVGLGNVELENVSVLGKIVICGGGEAEGGKQSILLRNVTAGALELDSLTEQFLSLQAEGLTDIKEVTIRTSGYVEDRTEDGLGLQTIRLDGIDGAQLQLAGNIKRVIDLTPNSTLQVAQGVADVVTIDERAVNAALTIDDEAVIRELNLDRGTTVTGKGSISHLNVNAPGSNVSMLPDTIYVRPGITGNVSNENMDTNAAAASSADPRLLSGYPKARNIAPTSAEAVFRTNKTGTIHWGLTALMDGSLGEEELMNPASYSKIIRSGTIAATAYNQDFTAQLAGLTREGSYYISALLEDARGRRSPVKVAAFTTPDDTAPNFAAGYPQNPILTVDADNEQVAQVMVMATKSCQMYYVLLPQGSTAPTAADFRAAALPGNLGYGVVTLRKNTPFLLSRINTSHLQEQTTYDLYLWLNDADNGKSSAVRRVQFTTRDMTPPTIQDLKIVDFNTNYVTLSFMLDEPGTLSWAVTKRGDNFGINKEDPTELDQIKIEGTLATGKVLAKGGPVRAARAATYYNFTVSGLEGQTEYDLFYAFKDTAGNYGVYNTAIEFPFPIKTRDDQGPVPKLAYSESTLDTQQVEHPWATSDVSIDFGERVQGTVDSEQGLPPVSFYELYQRVTSTSGEDRELAKRDLASALQNYIVLCSGNPPGNVNARPQAKDYVPNKADLKPEDLENALEWVDYREAVVSQANGKTVITFPNGTALKMQSGENYYFWLQNIEDISGNSIANPTYLSFSTTFATVTLTKENAEPLSYTDASGNTVSRESADVRIFSLDPLNTASVSRDTRWDMLIWSNGNIRFDLLVRLKGSSDWTVLGPMNLNISGIPDGEVYGSLNGTFNRSAASSPLVDSGLFGSIQKGQGLPFLYEFIDALEFAVAWDSSAIEQNLELKVQLFAGQNQDFTNISLPQGTAGTITNRVTSIGDPDTLTLDINRTRAPEVEVSPDGFQSDPSQPTRVTVNVWLRPMGNLWYIAVPLASSSGSDLPTGTGYTVNHLLGDPAVNGQKPSLDDIPDSGLPLLLDSGAPVTSDVTSTITEYMNLNNAPEHTAYGKVTSRSSAQLTLEDLYPNRTYLLYLVTQDVDIPYTPATQVACYKFTTGQLQAPKIRIETTSTTTATLQVDKDSDRVKYLLARTFQLEELPEFARTFGGSLLAPGVTLPSGYEGISVLEAMAQSDPSERGTYRWTIFDRYASDQAKSDYAQLILSYSNDRFEPPAIIPDEPFELKQYVEYPIEINEMQTTSEFTMIAVATVEDNTGETPVALYGFRASTAFRVTKDDNLYVRDYFIDDKTSESFDSTRFTGDITIYFTDTLCWQISPGKAANIDVCIGDEFHKRENGYIAEVGQDKQINYLHVITLPSPNLSATVSVKYPLPILSVTDHGSLVEDYLTFHLEAAGSGTRIVFRSSLCGPNGETKAQRDPLTVTLRGPDATNADWHLEFTNDWLKSQSTTP